MKTYTKEPLDVFISLFVIMFAAFQAGTAASQAPDNGKAQAACDSIFKIIDYPSQINAIAMDDDKSLVSADNIRGKIEFKDVWFRYPTRKEDFVLRGLSLVINPGESIALVGESGCGKSTFVNLVMRFYDVDFGEILIDDINIKNFNLHSLRQALSLVMQEPIIFNYPIKENILYGKINATNEEINDSAIKAQCMDFIIEG